MLELYHSWGAVCGKKVRLVLAEKGLAFEHHLLDMTKFEQFNEDYLKLNPNGYVPTLVHDGAVICESTVISEYLESVFPDPPLTPKDPVERAHMLYWTKGVDEDLHPACGALTFVASHRHTVLRLGPEGVNEFLESTPAFSVTADWHEDKKTYIRQGFDAPGAAEKVILYDRYLDKMEDALAGGEWLVGNQFSLADTSLIPYLNRLDKMSMAGLWEGRRPRLGDWWERVQARPSFKPAILDWVPDDLADDLKTFGAQSWPDMQRILGIG
ncbi:MAG: glutathione S-transferase family protein [Rhodospirillales bacterium]|nr:glutathione S-transferase family protein [Rhodospirillales bacterium]